VGSILHRSIRLTVIAGAMVFVLLAAGGFSYEQIGRWRDQKHRFRIGRPIDIGGRSLNIDCVGQGTPAVILESGGGGYALTHYAHIIGDAERVASERLSTKIGAQLESEPELESVAVKAG
jgi:hypothetical protein